MAVHVDYDTWSRKVQKERTGYVKSSLSSFLEKFHGAYVHVIRVERINPISFSSLLSFLNFFIEIFEHTTHNAHVSGFTMKEDGNQRLESSSQGGAA